jgi:hypothetical protein
MISASRRVLSWRILVALALLGASFPWAQWHSGPSRLSREPNGYYAELTQAFLAGQLHLKAKPDPQLEALANPYAGEQGVPRPWDVTYFNHRFYLYFGTPPVFLFFAPVRLISGLYLPDGLGTVFFGLVGFGLGAWLLLRLQARLFPLLGENWVVAGLAVWCLASHAQLLSHSYVVYPVPINGAFACLMAALACCLRAWENPGRVRWLVLGGLAWGLAIACRPNYLFSLGGLLAFLLGALLRNQGLPAGQRRSAIGIVLATGVPVLLVGVALAAYNWVRFHRITEFGTTYMLMAGDPRHLQLFPGHFWKGLPNMLWLPVDYSPYFPFAFPLGKGMLPTSPILLVILALPGLWFFSRPEERIFWRVGGTALLLTAAGNLLSISMLQTQEYRYTVDYLPATVLLAVLIGWSLVQTLSSSATGRARAGRLVLALALGVTLLHGVANNLAFVNLSQGAPVLSRWLDYPTHWIETALGYRYGALRLRGRLPAQAPGTILPVVVTGRGNDVLYVRYPGPDQIQFGFFHAGAGGPESVPFPLDLGQEHVFEIDLGSLYPPPEHPLFAGRSEREIKNLRQRVRVTVDGQVALDGACDFYPTHPGDLYIGENPWGILTRSARMDPSGFAVERLGLPTRPPAAAYPLKPVRLELTFPPFANFKKEPLISTGRLDAGDLLYVNYVGPNQLRLAHDSWGGGGIESWIVTYEPGRVYTLEVDMGSLHPHPAGARFPGRLQIRLDGVSIMDTTRPFHASDATELAFGYNAMKSTAAYSVFTGQIRKITSIDTLATPPQEYGVLRCAVQFPVGRINRAEPLAVSGRTGAGDFIYVVYSGDDTIRLGYDHWNSGGPLTDPIRLNYQETHLLEISMGSLLPPVGNDAAWGNLPPDARRQLAETITVKLDGRVVLNHPSTAYPAQPDEVAVGTNPIGGSTCDPLFTGRILSSERVPPGLPAPVNHP